MVKILLILLLSICMNAFAQTDWFRWGKANFSYKMPGQYGHRSYSFDTRSPQKLILSSLADGYWFFISDVDGDNCSFSPTCSSFFLQSVKETNIIQGTFMFFDRFTRDMDIYEKYDHYPRVKDGHFYDPPALYTLNKTKIKYIPPFVVVNSE